MQYKYYLNHMSFAQYMATLEDLQPMSRNQDLRLTRPQLNQVMRPMMRYMTSDELWIRKPTLWPSWQNYRKYIEDFIRSNSKVFSPRYNDPENMDLRIFHKPTVSTDILKRVSSDQGLKSLILAYIIVAIAVLLYIQYNIFYKKC